MPSRGSIGRLGLAAFALLALAVAPAAAAKPRPWTGLAGGQVGDISWSVKAKRSAGRDGAGRGGTRRPCLLVGTKWQVGPFDYRRSKFRRCAPTPPGGLSPSEPPLIASGVQPGAGGAPRLTAVGMIFSPAARRVRATFSDGSRETIRLELPTPLQSQRAGLGRFRYAAFAVRGAWQAERLVSLNAKGRRLWDSGTEG